MNGLVSPGQAGPTRRTPRALLVAAALLMTLRIASYHLERRHPIPMRNAMHWIDASDAEREARSQGKLVLYDISAHWCPPCKRLQREVFAVEEVARHIEKRFVAVQIMVTNETSSDPVLGPLLEQLQVPAYPTLVVMAPDGRKKCMHGYGGRESVEAFLRKAEAELRK